MPSRDDVAVLDEQKAFAYISRAVAARERSSCDIRAKLQKRGYDEAVIQAAISRAVKCGLVDDRRFAEAFLRCKIECGWSLNRISKELGSRGLSMEDIEDYPDAFVFESEYDRAIAALSKHRCHSKDPYASFMRYLLSKGYSFDIANRAVRNFLKTAV